MSQTLVIAQRFNGPPGSAHGGLACGLFATRAAQMMGGVQPNAVTLHRPPPLDVSLRVHRAGRRVQVWDRDFLVASVSRSDEHIRTIPFCPPDVIADAEHGYVSAHQHPFPACFACGPLRAGADGLGLAPGPLPGRTGATGCFWVPDASLGAGAGQQLPLELAWAAMDCPGGWTADLSQTPMVLSRFTTALASPPVPGMTYVIVGERDGDDGHILTATTTLYRLDGTIAGKALARWSRITSGAFLH